MDTDEEVWSRKAMPQGVFKCIGGWPQQYASKSAAADKSSTNTYAILFLHFAGEFYHPTDLNKTAP